MVLGGDFHIVRCVVLMIATMVCFDPCNPNPDPLEFHTSNHELAQILLMKPNKVDIR